MTHKVVVLGAGYAGLPAARRLANQVRRDAVEVTVVNASPDFVERPRLHQMSTGQQVRRLPLREVLDPAGVRLLVGAVTRLDLAARSVTVAAREGEVVVPYDTCVYALGSTVDRHRVPGVAQHTHAFTDPGAAERLYAAAALVAAHRGVFAVCGGGLTGIEGAAELAETFPDLQVLLVSARPAGDWLAPRGRARLDRAFDRLGVTRRTGERVVEVRDGALLMEGGGTVPFDACLWAGGFTVPRLAADAGLTVDGAGRVRVDQTLRVPSHPDVYVIGDAVAASGPWGDSQAMGCRTGGFTGPYVADAVATRLAGREPGPFRFRYLHECISLGRGDGVVQFLHADERPHDVVLTGRTAARYKEGRARLRGLAVPVPRPVPAVATAGGARRAGSVGRRLTWRVPTPTRGPAS
ncbi:MAG: NAD(P)/FAD-dependent oxidoreductase, partial [Actinomycetes bacterium]